MDYALQKILNIPVERGLEVRIRNTTVKHVFYFDRKSEIKVINIPRCGSTSLKLALNKHQRPKDYVFKCVLFRDPVERLKSTMFYTMVNNRNFVKSWKLDDFDSKANLLIEIMKKRDKGTWNNGYLLLHYIPQKFFYENSFRIDKRDPDLIGIVGNIPDMEAIAEAFGIKEVTHSHMSKYTKEFNKFFRRWYRQHVNFFDMYYADDWEIYKKLKAEKQELNKWKFGETDETQN